MENNRKIGFIITSTGWGGLEMNTLKLARLLTEKGFQITLFTQEKSTIFKEGQSVFNAIVIIKKNRKYFDFKGARFLGKQLVSNNICRLLVVDNKDLDLAVWTKKREHKNLKIVYQQHMQIGINKKDWLHTFRFKAIDVWVSPLPFLKREIAIRTNFPLSLVKVLPIGLNTATFSERKYTKVEARNLLGIKSDLPLVGIIGRVSKKKGQLFLVECLMEMQEYDQKFNVLIFGSATINDEEDQKYYQELVQFVEVNNLSDNVFFAEAQADTAKFYNAIDVFVLASHSETYGMVTIEAMLNALPILATNSGGTPEIVGNGEYGSLYKYEETSDFIEKLKSILSNMEAFQAKAKLAQKNALNLYDEREEAQSFAEIFDEL